MKTTLVIVALALCLTGTAAMAQTPAQDKATVEADKQSVSDAQNAVQADTLQLNTDEKSGDRNVVQTDTNNLIADKQAETNAEQQLKEDKKELHREKEDFDDDGD